MIGLGLDAGGSATRWAIWGDEGRLGGGELIPVTGHLFHDAERARFAEMAAALRCALAGARVTRVIAGITGLSATAPEAAVAAAALSDATGVPIASVAVEDDIWIAYHAAFAPGEGHVVYAGTGSIAVHIRTDRSVVRVGGRGMLIDDGGSAFWIGREALNAIFRAIDADPAARPPLADAVFTMIGSADWDRVRAYVYGGGRSAVAQLARAAGAAADAGDPAAIRLMRETGKELARLARVLAAREGPRPVALLGRAAGLHPAILESMQRATAPLVVERRTLDAAATAARLAYAHAVHA
ncbi:MAG TPA: BadF/BadG/BcrA/BcrD ATPase family protein [Acetobacteraceae bacterium]|nr:BadF/BadG/BcrA/BcrD ATPase family protein [Acetobacteraceae bacterium]